jgi:hypothetical protein
MVNTPIPHTPRSGVLLVIGIVLFLAACWALPNVFGQSDNLVVNGSFMDGTTGWDYYWSNCSYCTGWTPQVINSSMTCDVDQLSFEMHMAGGGASGLLHLYQNIDVTAGTYIVSTWTRWNGQGTYFDSGPTMSIGGESIVCPHPNDDSVWTQCVMTVTLSAGVQTLDFNGGRYVIDHVFLGMIYPTESNCPNGPSSCYVSDPNFSSPSSWTPSATGATYSSGQWNLAPGGTIQQDVYLSVGIYTPTIAARTTSGSAILNFGVYLTSTTPITISSSSWSYYYSSINVSVATTYTVRLEADPDNASNIVIDSVCFAPSLAPGLPSDWANCGLTQSDLNTNVFQNPSLDSGWGYYWPPGGIELWFPTSWTVGTLDVKRSPGYSFSTASVGLLKQVDAGDRSISQQLSSPLSRFNLVMMVKRLKSDSQLRVDYNNGAWWNPLAITQATISNTTLNEWQPVGVWFDLPQAQNWRIYLRGVCPSCSNWDDGYVVDEIYAIPGTSAVVCASSPPAPNPQPVPSSGCINGNAHMAGPDGTYQMTYGAAVDGAGYPWVWNWHGRMGTLTPWEHVARLFQTTGYDAYVHQYMPAAYGDVSREYSGVLADRQYDVFGSVIGYQAPSDSGPIQPSTATVSIGNISGSTFSFDVTIDSNQPSTTFWQTFTATQGMFAGPCSEGDSGGCNISFDINNRGGTSALIDLACVRPFSATIIIPTDPPTGTACLGSWDRSEGGDGLGYVEVGTYLYSDQTLNGDYRLWITGEADGSGVLRVMYLNTSTGITVALGAMNVGAGNNTVNTTFVTPPSGYYGGQVIVEPSVGITITSACLQSSAIPPVEPPVTPPIVIPMPTCGSVNFGASSPWITNTIGFYGRPPYTETAIMSGTLYSDVNWAEYMAMQTYNYAIYPLVCTTISVANWQVEAYNALMAFLAKNIGTIQPPGGNSCGTGLWAVLCELIKVIGNSINQLIGLLQSLIDLIKLILQLIASLVGLIMTLLGRLLGLIWIILNSAIGLLGSLVSFARGTDRSAYPIDCAGDAEAICFGLAAIVKLDEIAGNWLTIITTLTVSVLTIYLGMYIVNQVRSMMQPGSGAEDGE